MILSPQAAFFVKNLTSYLTLIWTTVTGLSFALSGTVTEFIAKAREERQKWRSSLYMFMGLACAIKDQLGGKMPEIGRAHV